MKIPGLKTSMRTGITDRELLPRGTESAKFLKVLKQGKLQ